MAAPAHPDGGNALSIARRSLPSETAAVLRREIAAGRWRGALPGERQLTTLLQVSRTSLRPALRQLEEEGLIRAAQGKRREIVGARTRRRAAPRGLAVLVSPIPLERIEPFILLELENLRELLAPKKMTLHIEVRPSCFSGRPDRPLRLLVEEMRADVWILLRSSREMQHWFLGNRKPHVVMGTSHYPDSPYVDLDHHATGHHAATTLARLGHRRAAVLIQNSGLAGDEAMIAGFRAGVATDPSPLRIDLMKHDGTPEAIVRNIDRLLTLSPRPTAIFSAGGAHTICAITRLLERGIRIPDKISILSRDDDPTLDYVNPAPARYHRPPLKFAVGVIRQIDRLFPIARPGKGILIFPLFQAKATLGRGPGRETRP